MSGNSVFDNFFDCHSGPKKIGSMINWKPLANKFLYSDAIHSLKKGKCITGFSLKHNFVIIKIYNLYAELC